MVVLKDKARSPLALAISAALAVTFAAPAGAHTPDIKPDETLVVYGNPLYGMSPSEETGGYGVDSATVGTKTPAALKDIPSRSPC